MKQKVYLLLALLSCSLFAIAKERSIDEIKKVANQALQSKFGMRRDIAVQSNLSITKRMQNLTIVTSDKDGFVVVANDDEVADIIGYSKTQYDQSKLPDNFQWWLNAANTSLRKKNHASAAQRTFDFSISPLIQTQWSQFAPYNNLCPVIDGEKCLTGCVATAMAQVLYYYHYPLQGQGSHTYTYSFDYENTIFQWGNMLANYENSSYNETQSNAVATLMYACGVSVNMNYGLEASSAGFVNIIDALKDYFGYDEGDIYGRDTYAGDWMSLIFNELSNSRPVFYCGSNDDYAHAFLIDGCDTDGKVHINWGWGGRFDGFFDIDALDPENDGGYNANQYMIVNFRDYQDHPNLSMTAMTTIGEVSVGKQLMIAPTVSNSGQNFNGPLYLFVSTNELELGSESGKQNVTINQGQNKNIVFMYTPMTASTYYLTIAADDKGKDIVGTGKLNVISEVGNIEFKDLKFKSICISKWDSNGDGELSYAEAANVTEIGNTFWANQEIENLEELQFFTGLTIIPTTAFSGCVKLKTICLPEGIKKIGDSVFWDCYELQSINIPATLTIMGSDCFRRCNSLTSIEVDENNQSFTSVDGIMYNKSQSALIYFPPAKQITKYVVPNTVTTINDYSCLGNCFLEDVEITANVKSIGGSAFSNCTALKAVYVPDNVTTIGCNTWHGCTSLTSAYIGKGVNFMKNDLFGGCTSLEAIDVAEDNQYYCSVDGLLLSKDKTTLYQYPSGKKDETFIIPTYITKNFGDPFRECKYLKTLEIHGSYSVGQTEFWYFTSLENLILHEGIKTIGLAAFSNCENLYSISIPSSVTKIDESAFAECPNIRIVRSDITNPFELNQSVFDNSDGGIYTSSTLVVPDGYIDVYKGTKGWDLFVRIRETSAPDIIPERVRTINLPLEGILSYFIPEEDKYFVEEMTISGKLNAVDLQLIRDMAGNNYKGELTNGRLRKIDMSNVTFVTGDDYYIEAEWIALDAIHSIQGSYSIITSTDYFPGYLFTGTKIESVTLPTSVKNIGDRAFANCKKLSTIVFPNDLQYIGSSAFSSCESLASMTIPGNTYLDRYAFAYCDGLVNLELCEGLLFIPDNCFFQCTKLASVTLPESLSKIGVQAFQATAIKSIFIPQNVSTIMEMAFSRCYNLEKIEVDTRNRWYFSQDDVLYSYGYQILMQYPVAKKESTYSVIPGTLSIGSGAFSDCNNLKEIIMPKSLKTIGGESFLNCQNLEEVTIPILVNSLWYSSFKGCNNLKKVISKMLIPCAMSYESRAFDAFDDITLQTATLYVPYGKKEKYKVSEGWKDFKNIIEVENNTSEGIIHFADDYAKSYSVAYWDTNNDDEVSKDEAAAVTDLGDVYRYSDMESFDELKYFTGLDEIAYHAFNGCNNLKSVILPNTITRINSWAFKDCKLTSIQLPENLEYLLDDAFENCDELTTVTIPKKVYAARDMIFCSHPFSGCDKLVEIKVDPENPYLETIDNVLYLKDHTNIMQYPAGKKGEKYTILKGVTGLAGGIFAGCQYLKSVIVPEGVTYFNGSVFKNSPSLEKIEIPSTITTFDGYHLILGCTNLKKIISHITNPSDVSYDVFVVEEGENVFTSATLYVPKGTKAIYQQRGGWCNFKEIVEMGDFLEGDANGDGEVTITDAVAVVNKILGNASENFVFEAADVNGDGVITITDAVGVVNIILNGGGASAPTLDNLLPMAEPE